MLEISSSDRICVSGLPRSGKTVFMRYLATMAEPNILIIDPLDQYQGFPDKCRYIPRQETPQELEMICKQLWARNNCTLIIEEAEQYIAQGRPLLDFTSGLIRMGRNWGIGIWCTTRRIQDLNKRFFDLSQHVFFFRCGFKSREYIANMVGAEYMYPTANPKLNKTGYTITTLPPFHALHFNLETEVAQIITLRVSARSHIVEVGKKSEGGKEVVKEIAEAEKKVPQPQRSEEVKAPRAEVEPPSEPQKQQLWSPARKQ